jgi:hypothetical protein
MDHDPLAEPSPQRLGLDPIGPLAATFVRAIADPRTPLVRRGRLLRLDGRALRRSLLAGGRTRIPRVS